MTLVYYDPQYRNSPNPEPRIRYLGSRRIFVSTVVSAEGLSACIRGLVGGIVYLADLTLAGSYSEITTLIPQP